MTVEITDEKSLVELRSLQHAAFYVGAPGIRFDEVSSLIDAFPSGESIMAFGAGERSIIRLTKELNVVIEREVFSDDSETGKISEKEIKAKHRGWSPLLVEGLTPGCVPCVAEVDGCRYGAGLVILAGKGDVGKTPFIHAFGSYIAAGGSYATIRFGEPLSGYNSDLDAFITDVAEAMISHKVIVIDSFKDLVGASGGNATKGGVTRGVFQIMSDIGAMAATRGCMIIAAINPTSSDQRVIDEVNEAARSNATALVISSDGSEWEVVSRVGEGLQRVSHTLRSYYGDDRVMHFNANDKSKRSSKSVSVQTTISNSEFESVIRRMTNA